MEKQYITLIYVAVDTAEKNGNGDEKTKEPLSFNKMQSICEEHFQEEETKKCYCDITGKNCNKSNCPKLREDEGQESEEAQ
jgi:hypothetical protein